MDTIIEAEVTSKKRKKAVLVTVLVLAGLISSVFITNTGKGILPEVAENLFSPFFSTKKDGQGIGLTLVKEILINHGFEFSLKTVSAGKTQFVIGF